MKQRSALIFIILFFLVFPASGESSSLASGKPPAGRASEYYRIGRDKARAGDNTGAELYFSKAIKEDGSFFEAFFDRGVVRHRTGKLKEALKDMNRAVALDGRYYVLFTRALVKRDMGELSGALEDLNSAIGRNKNFVEAYSERAEIFSRRGNREKAMSDLAMVIRLEPTKRRGYNRRAFEFAATGRYREALKDAEKAMSLAPRHPAAFDTAGYIYLLMNNYKKAEEMFRKSVRLDPDEPYSYGALGYLCHKTGRMTESGAYFQKAAGLDKNNLMSGHLKRLMRIDPGGPLGKMAEAQLRQYVKFAGK